MSKYISIFFLFSLILSGCKSKNNDFLLETKEQSQKNATQINSIEDSPLYNEFQVIEDSSNSKEKVVPKSYEKEKSTTKAQTHKELEDIFTNIINATNEKE